VKAVLKYGDNGTLVEKQSTNNFGLRMSSGVIVKLSTNIDKPI